jgi:hypothetical protein
MKFGGVLGFLGQSVCMFKGAAACICDKLYMKCCKSATFTYLLFPLSGSVQANCVQ